ncbi:MAG: NADH-quinone oxidoreductase subunit N [Muribaculaceae bacterium]|nr:NADH-quinone oxidoreductase subunit N [Muribaculaceae bacterium]MCI6495403.1 NADH-quinone oxidoreductase subunit N [Bacteroidales bacterium]MDD6701274.1 NADH-quinone oxidoreductase subunit N [Bacteroidales bacterium]MDD6943451.1 NADH-quinone oxidoreductase subunit N [Bacteroidales bacterium]MDY2733875.1 NADH-quinone oxidoreductase subunit N [Muribaculaceae bacterium]
MDYSQFWAMMPELIILGLFFIVFILDVFSKDGSNKKFLTPVSTILFGLATVAIWVLPAGTEAVFGGMYINDAACKAIKAILNIGVFIVFLQSAKWVDSDEVAIRKGEFYELMLATLFGMYLMISARHLLLFVIGLETASLPLAAMVAFNKKHYESHEAAIKYILTAVFSSAILLMGLSFVYAFSGEGSLYFEDIRNAVTGQANSGLMICALAFVIAGIGFKLSLVPFHLWTADTYQGAPTAITAYLSVISKGAAAFTFFVIFVQAFGTLYEGVWEWMMYAVIIATITIGNIFAIRQKNLKRFMAFSSISQAGYIMLGVMTESALGLASMIYYIFVYIVSNLAVFSVIAAIENKTGKVGMDDYDGLHKTNPWLSFAMTLAMFSLAGIPPFAGFFSKFLIFTSVTASGSMALYMLVLIALINTIISLYYYLLVVKAMWINPGEAKVEAFKSSLSERLSIWICVAGIILFGIVPCIYAYCFESANLLSIFAA